MNRFVYRTLCKNYEASALLMVAEIRRLRNEVSFTTNPVALEYKENLKLLRQFLDNEGIVMPRPKWIYDDKDQRTWLFTPQKSLNKNFLMLQARRR